MTSFFTVRAPVNDSLIGSSIVVTVTSNQRQEDPINQHEGGSYSHGVAAFPSLKNTTIAVHEPARHNQIVRLWRAFESTYLSRAIQTLQGIDVEPHSSEQRTSHGSSEELASTQEENDRVAHQESSCSSESCTTWTPIQTDVKVRHEKKDNDSSWSDAAPDHYNAWEVLRDEYAKDFGFDYSDTFMTPEDAVDDTRSHFRILGTNANDVSAHPHVLSPPLMDSLMTFLPESLQNQNYLLKYSLVRDGASLSTLKHQVRASSKTILAIETTNGQIFGSFTSDAWRDEKPVRYYGSGESFLWKMRHNRNAPNHSLMDQAKMETEIDVYGFSHVNEMVQLCTKSIIAIGGGKLVDDEDDHDKNMSEISHCGGGVRKCASMDETPPAPLSSNKDENIVWQDENDLSKAVGYGIALNDDLLHGTSSPCATFRNPCLVNHSASSEAFEVLNLEVWTFTPCETIHLAQKLEMTQYFVRESLRQSSKQHRRGYDPLWCAFRAGDLPNQQEFFRRVGDDEERARRWENAAMRNCSSVL